MKNFVKVDFDKKQIIMDRTFAANAENVRSEEYATLQNVRRDYPEFEVVRRQIKKNPSKESYRGLTYGYMENYIVSHANAKQNMEEYKELRLLAECHSIRYPKIKNWFFDAYPEVKEYYKSRNSSEQTPSDENSGSTACIQPETTSLNSDAVITETIAA